MIFRKRNIVKGNFPRKQEFLEGVEDCMNLAWSTFPDFQLTMADIEVVFFPKGGCVGSSESRVIGGVRYYNLEFNVAAIQLEWEDTYLDTIPHEIAHMVTGFLNRVAAKPNKKLRSHGPEWIAVAKKLGCDGERCHTLNIPRGKPRRRRPRQLYISDTGAECILGPNQHNKLQRTDGYWMRIRATGEELFPHNHVGDA